MDNMGNPTAKELEEHITELCRKHRVYLKVDPDMKPDNAVAGRWHNGVRWIRVPPILGEEGYIIAMHELGHHVSPHGSLHVRMSDSMRLFKQPSCARDVRLGLEQEIAAWNWARRNAKVWTPTSARIRSIGFGTYKMWAKQFGVK